MTSSADIRSYLEAIRKLRGDAPAGCAYNGFEDFVLDRGKPMAPPDEPAPEVLRGPAKECYANAGRVVLDGNDDYLYVEGWAVAAALGFPVEHAWLLDRRTNKVVDPTWPDGVAYYGVTFEADGVRNSALTNEVYGMFHYGNRDLLRAGDKIEVAQ